MAQPRACAGNTGQHGPSWSKRALGDCSQQKAHGGKLGVPGVMAAHWLGRNSLSLVGLLPGEVETLPPPT